MSTIFWVIIIVLGIYFYILWSNHKYFYTYDSDIDITFKQQVRDILSNSNWNNYRNYSETDNEEDADIYIQLTHRDAMPTLNRKKEYYPNGEELRFSVTRYGDGSKPSIHIDHMNWLYGSKHSGLSLDEYRRYIINHEFGHGLGYDHQPCSITNLGENGRCPVMYQSTRGCPSGIKCGYEPVKKDTNARIEL